LNKLQVFYACQLKTWGLNVLSFTLNLFQYQSKSVTPVDDYECNLSPELLEILEKELRETEETRNHGITALREWMMQNPRIIKTRLDSAWLLKHLRFKKYCFPAAVEAIERHMVLRQGKIFLDTKGVVMMLTLLF
jgi:hypothetical protein